MSEPSGASQVEFSFILLFKIPTMLQPDIADAMQVKPRLGLFFCERSSVMSFRKSSVGISARDEKNLVPSVNRMPVMR